MRAQVTDDRVRVLSLPSNQGVGGATISGFDAAVAEGANIVVKLDGDGQIDPALVPYIIRPIAEGKCDYSKGNRFFAREALRGMPKRRLIGNAFLSFMAKASSGYWHIFDPNNGFVAISADVYGLLPTEKLARRYFFESDMLFRLNTIGARVLDMPMMAIYADEISSLRPFREIPRFAHGHIRNFAKRILYSYFLRDFNVASVELLLSIVFITFGLSFGIYWWNPVAVATPGTVMLAALPIILGVQLFLAFLNFDVAAVPRFPLHGRIAPGIRDDAAKSGLGKQDDA